MHQSHCSHSQTRDKDISQFKMHQGITSTTTYQLENPRIGMSAIVLQHHSHSQTREMRTGIISWLETHQGSTATHILKSQV